MEEKEESANGVGSFKQQDLKGWQPVLTPTAVITILVGITLVFLPIGIILRDSSKNVIEQKVRYDNDTNCAVTSSMNFTELPIKCVKTFTVTKSMKAPIYFYYELKNFYQNHRRYLKSKSNSQLRGDPLTSTKLFTTECDPLRYEPGSNNKRLLACGLISASYFEDRFSMSVDTGSGAQELCTSGCTDYGSNTTGWQQGWANWHSEPNWSKSGIAWKSDLKKKYVLMSEQDRSQKSRQGPRQLQTGLFMPEVNDEDFVVWMRVAALPHFRKLHRIIRNRDLNEGDTVSVTIMNWFPVSEFDGEKSFVLAQTTWCGGTNYALAWTYIIVSCITIFLAVALAILLLFGSRKMGDVDKFDWHNKPQNDGNDVLIDSQ